MALPDGSPPTLSRAASSSSNAPVGIREWREMRTQILVQRRQEVGWDHFFTVALANAGGKGQRGWLDFLTSKVTRSSRKVHPTQEQVDSSFSSHSSIGRRAEASIKKQASSSSFGVKIKRQVSRSILQLASLVSTDNKASVPEAAPSPSRPVPASTGADEPGSAPTVPAPAPAQVPDQPNGPSPSSSEQASDYDKRRRVLLAEERSEGWRGSKHLGVYKEGIYEDRKHKQIRAQIRLLPEVQGMVDKMWTLLAPQKARVQLGAYLDFHLSIYHYIMARETPPVLPDQIDLLDAFAAAIDDWRSDTEDALALVHKRELHFHLFRDSIFELIDLYTPTTDAKQYIGYMRVLFDSVSNRGALRLSWPKPHKRAAASALLRSLRATLAAATPGGWEALEAEETTARVATWFHAALDAQVAADADADADGTAAAAAAAAATVAPPTAPELTLAGFLAAVDPLLSDELRAGHRTGGREEALLLIDLFRRFDADASGGVSLEDLTAVLVQGAPSSWFPEKRKSSFGLNSKVMVAIRMGALGRADASVGAGGEQGSAPEGGAIKGANAKKKMRNMAKVAMMATKK